MVRVFICTHVFLSLVVSGFGVMCPFLFCRPTGLVHLCTQLRSMASEALPKPWGWSWGRMASRCLSSVPTSQKRRCWKEVSYVFAYCRSWRCRKLDRTFVHLQWTARLPWTSFWPLSMVPLFLLCSLTDIKRLYSADDGPFVPLQQKTSWVARQHRKKSHRGCSLWRVLGADFCKPYHSVHQSHVKGSHSSRLPHLVDSWDRCSLMRPTGVTRHLVLPVDTGYDDT